MGSPSEQQATPHATRKPRIEYNHESPSVCNKHLHTVRCCMLHAKVGRTSSHPAPRHRALHVVRSTHLQDLRDGAAQHVARHGWENNAATQQRSPSSKQADSVEVGNHLARSARRGL